MAVYSGDSWGKENYISEVVQMDNINPKHYRYSSFETIDVIKDVTEDLTGIQAVDTANVIKYITRWPRKNGLEDLKKARWYLDHLIKTLEEEQ